MFDGFQIQAVVPSDVQIERFLEQQIRDGDLVHTQRLPTTAELARLWRVDRSAVQRALSRLAHKGLLVRKPRCGTFVSVKTAMPTLAVVIGSELAREESRFYREILRAVTEEARAEKWDCCWYDKVQPNLLEWPHGRLHDASHWPLKGILWIDVDLDLAVRFGVPSTIPQVHFGMRGGSPSVDVDMYAFVQNAIDCLVRHGRHSLIYIRAHVIHGFHADVDGFLDGLRRHGLPPRPDAIVALEHLRDLITQGISVEQFGHDRMIELINDWNRNRTWPDAMIVSDDVVLKGMAIALRECRSHVPSSFLIAAGLNQNIRYPYHVPLLEFQLPVCTIAKQLLSLLRDLTLGKPAPTKPILVQHEIPSNNPNAFISHEPVSQPT